MIGTPLYCPRFIDRDAELFGLLELARQAATGRGAVAIVSGEAGIGKTRFLTEFRKSLPRGVASFGAACLEFAPAPLGPIQTILGAIEAASRAKLGSVALFEDPAPPDRALGKLVLFQRVADVLRRACAERPIVIVIDDLHWADTATLEIVQFLAVELSALRVLLVLGYRSEALAPGQPLAVALGRLERRENVQRFELEPLPQAGIQALIDATLAHRESPAPGVIRDVRLKCEGNPLFAEELLKAGVDRKSDSTVALPNSLRAAILERLRRFSPVELRLLETAALVGRRFRVAFLERVSGQAETEVLAFLRLAVQENLLVEDRVELGWFVFRHALVRETILSGMLLIELRAMHLRIAEEIEREPDFASRSMELSDHYWNGAAFAQCAPHAAAAAKEAHERYAYREAFEQYERALACGAHADLDRAGLHKGAAEAHFVLGNAQKSVEHLELATALYSQMDDHKTAAACFVELALAHRRHGDIEAAFLALGRAAELERLAPGERLRAELFIRLAQLNMLNNDWEKTAQQLDKAEPLLAAAAPDDVVLFHSVRASLLFARRDWDGWQTNFQDATLAARRSGGGPALTAMASTNFGLEAMKIGRIDLALPALQAVVAEATRFGALYNITFARAGFVQALLYAGRLEEARAQLQELLAETRESLTMQVLTALLGITLSIVLRDEALFERSYSDGLLARARAEKDSRLFGHLAAALAEKHLADGDEAGAANLLNEMLASPSPGDDLACELAIPVAVCCGAVENEVAEELLRSQESAPNSYVRACTDLFHAYKAARFGSKADSIRRAEVAARLFADLHMPLLEAEAYALAGQGSRAAVICERIGARRTQRRLSSGGRGTAIGELTPREREVVNLVVRGLSNSAIASELSLSERTVESHVAAAYRKLGVRSRAELLLLSVASD